MLHLLFPSTADLPFLFLVPYPATCTVDTRRRLKRRSHRLITSPWKRASPWFCSLLFYFLSYYFASIFKTVYVCVWVCIYICGNQPSAIRLYARLSIPSNSLQFCLRIMSELLFRLSFYKDLIFIDMSPDMWRRRNNWTFHDR